MLKGKTALVTGSTSGIGQAIAKRLAEDGANVVINGFGDKAEIEAFADDLAKTCGVQVLYSPADMSKPAQIREMMDMAADKLGGVDVLVNNAGIQHVSPVEDFPEDKWDAIIAINMSSAFHTTKAAVPGMREQGWGRIINIASVHSLVASPYKSAYVTAKHGVTGLTKTVALECARDGITVNAVSPGYVWTPLVEKQIPDTAKARGISEEEVVNDVMLSAQPSKQFVTVEQIAGMVAFLCTDTASSINGMNMHADGGWVAQ